ncbi:hypothetical protein [Cytobacillus horneckiae]|uniref:Uncharacterized protein n=1 Tax=Cytobacillus horneckiae TaxID=549687 RepID=A0A2N0ZCG1_9BACI|nr:hypothetical protein [Cytobacillus horneckiae]MCM3180953.1 hypothetical protein [Cytobacillus horneckiae]MEC1158121.1 hypothetical protein [Cytobacillus horneckiae]MED2936392.1 hypothetical protein [Cytobacillus horneckiae]PKG27174.1 hypothetical protein CWS20_20210 [Cytobacillus horneckiae]
MSKKAQLTISTRDLIEALAQSECEISAREIGKENKWKKREIDKLINSVDQKNDKLFSGLEEIIDHIVHVERKVRFDKGEEYIAIYSADNHKNIMIEKVQNSRHTFYTQPLAEGFIQILCGFYGYASLEKVDPVKMNLQIDRETYDLIHTVAPEGLDKMIVDEKFEPQIRTYLQDFRRNGKIECKIIYAKNTGGAVDSVVLFVPGSEYIWSIDYEKVENNQIIATSSSTEQFFQLIERSLYDYLGESIPQKNNLNKKKKAESKKKFSFQRGLSFFGRGNVLLLILLLFFFLNKNSWSYDGGTFVLLFAVQTELVIFFLSLIACLPAKKERVQQ